MVGARSGGLDLGLDKVGLESALLTLLLELDLVPLLPIVLHYPLPVLVLIPVEVFEHALVPLVRLVLVGFGPERAFLHLLGLVGVLQLLKLLLIVNAFFYQVVLVVEWNFKSLQFFLQLAKVILC